MASSIRRAGYHGPSSSGLASLLPALIDHLTPKGQVETETPLSASLSALRGRFNV